ncbi:MAG: hypothetical protein AB7Y46_11655 [Armatimonadota bacterium]
MDAQAGSFASHTPVMKLRVTPGLFDGKLVSVDGGPLRRLRAATEAAFVLAEPGALGMPALGQSYAVYDVGPGDQIEVVR